MIIYMDLFPDSIWLHVLLCLFLCQHHTVAFGFSFLYCLNKLPQLHVPQIYVLTGLEIRSLTWVLLG